MHLKVFSAFSDEKSLPCFPPQFFKAFDDYYGEAMWVRGLIAIFTPSTDQKQTKIISLHQIKQRENL